jgi:hypothetical protein
VTLEASGNFVKPQKLKTMKTKQMLLPNLQGQLSRAEMKQIMAGDENLGGEASCTIACKNGGSDTGTTCEKADPCKDKGGRAGGQDCYCN